MAGPGGGAADLAASLSGSAQATERLLPLVYDELRAIAQGLMAKERREHTLQPTALVHEAYLRLIGDGKVTWQGKTHFRAIAARQMRRILIDHARARGTRKRGHGRIRITLGEGVAVTDGRSIDSIALEEALAKLAQANARHCEVVELRYFGGLSVEETAHQLGIAERTVKQDWRLARAWLLRELERCEGE